MKVLYLILIVLLSSCSNMQAKYNKPNLETECQLSGSSDSLQCQIYNDPNLEIDDKEQTMGFIYFVGSNGIKKDCERAKYWFEKSAKKNNAEALNGLGLIYNYGCGVNENSNKAEEFYLQAYQNGSRQAAANLGSGYVNGEFGTKRDSRKAIKWFELAINDTPLRAYKGLAQAYYYLEDYENSYKYTLKAAKLEDAESQHNIGYMYETGIYVDKDIEKAKYWYEKSAAQGFPLAFDKLESLSK